MKLKVEFLTEDRRSMLSNRYKNVLRRLYGKVVAAKISLTHLGIGLEVDIEANGYIDEPVIIYDEDIEKVYEDQRPGMSYCSSCRVIFETSDLMICKNCKSDRYTNEFIHGSKRTSLDMDSLIDELFEETYEM